jgi:ribose transport system permease protein
MTASARGASDLPRDRPGIRRRVQFSQERIVFLIAVVIFLGFAATLPAFLSFGNLLSLLQNVAILGILGIGMAQVIIGRGIDLSMVVTMVISVAWFVALVNHGLPFSLALLLGLALASLIGLTNGLLVAFADIPAIFATLAMGTAVYGFGKWFLVETDVINLAEGHFAWIPWAGGGELFSVPAPVVVASTIAAVTFLFLRFTRPGRFIFSIGDNPAAARITGIPARPLLVAQYVFSAAVAFVAGLVTAGAVNAINTRQANSTLIYDVILVVVIGGVGLSGGKGGVRNVIVGTLLIGVVLNGMTILNVPYTLQSIIKSIILLIAIVTDSIINPRDEQTSQQGDI